MFTGNENQKIGFAAAGTLTRRYRDSMEALRVPYKKGGFFGSEGIQNLLDQENCVGIRYYYGLDANDVQVMVWVGVDSDENDLVGEDNLCLEMSIPCPDNCSEDNVLNS